MFPPFQIRTITAWQYGWQDVLDQREMRHKLTSFYEDNFNATDIEVLATYTKPYSYRWDKERVEDGYIYKMFDMQV